MKMRGMITGTATVLGMGTRSNQKVRTNLIKVRASAVGWLP
jgi:hypothetical protein